MATVKDRVIALCKERNISVNKLQQETGIGNVVSRWDIYTPRINKLQAVADYFGIPVEALTGTKSIDEYLSTEKTQMLLTDIQEIDAITMLRQLDTISRYYIYGQIAALLRDQQSNEAPEEKDDVQLSTSKVG